MVKANSHHVMVHISTGSSSSKAHHRPTPPYVPLFLCLITEGLKGLKGTENPSVGLRLL